MSLDFAGSIAANLAAQQDPEWYITAGQKSFSSADGQQAVISAWDMIEDDADQSQLKILLANPELIYSGAFKYDEDMEIRFGYSGQLSPKAYFQIAEVKEIYPTDKHTSIEVVGRDIARKLSGKNNKGKLPTGKDAINLRKILEKTGIKLEGGINGADSGCASLMNEHDRAACFRLARQLDDSSARAAETGASDGTPQSPLGEGGSGSGGQADSGMSSKDAYTFSTAPDWSGNGKAGDRAKNRAKNHKGGKTQEPIQGKLELKGFPTLRAAGTIDIVGVGSDASGTYYVKKVHNKWDSNRGYTTSAELTRGGTGKGGVGGEPEIIMHAAIWQKGTVYCGPRKTTGPAQAVFTYGECPFWVSFEYHLKPQPQRGGGEKTPTKGEGIILRKRLIAKSYSSEDK